MSRSCVRVASWVAGMSSMMAWASVASGQVVYEDVGGAAGMGQYRPAMGMSAGIAAADFDDDGDIDVYVPTIAGAPDQVYRNRGDGRFDEVGASLGLASPGNNRAGLWIDYDGDGRLDLLTLRDCHRIDGCADETSLRLYRQNESGGFDDVTAGAGLLLALSPPHLQKHAGGLAAGDLNGDGWLDIWVAMWRGMSHILINNGDGTFRDATAGSGVDILKAYWQPILTDINGDGLTDAWANVDFDPNHLWINNGDETFRDLAPAAGCATKYNEMGAAMGDYDNDGDFDFYASNIFQYSAIPDSHSVLYRNDSTPGSIRMTEVGFDAGVADTGWGWGATFLDADNDGLLDLAVTNGFFGSEPRFAVDPSRLYLNRGDGTFEDRAAACGFDDTDWGMGLIALDVDRDGWLDVLQACNEPGPLRLRRCMPEPPASANHWLVVRPRMEGPNTRAIGAVVRVTTSSGTRMRQITAGTSVLSQEPPEAHFGLGADDTVRELVIEWPGGGVSVRRNLAPDQIIDILRTGCPADVNADGALDFFDFLEFLNLFARQDPRADVDQDGAFTALDFQTFQSDFVGGCR